MQLITRSRLALWLPALAALTLLAACGLATGMGAASRGVDEFHRQFNDEKFADIYAATTQNFKTATTQADFLKFIEAVHRKLGACKRATANGWNTNATTSGTFVRLSYKSEFERGPANESFMFVVSGEKAILQSYDINSRVLIVN